MHFSRNVDFAMADSLDEKDNALDLVAPEAAPRSETDADIDIVNHADKLIRGMFRGFVVCVCGRKVE